MNNRQERIRNLFRETVKEVVTPKYSIRDVQTAIADGKLIYPHHATGIDIRKHLYFAPLTPIVPVQIDNEVVIGTDHEGNEWEVKIPDIASIDKGIAAEGEIKVPVANAIKMNPDALAKIAKNADVTITDSVDNGIDYIDIYASVPIGLWKEKEKEIMSYSVDGRNYNDNSHRLTHSDDWALDIRILKSDLDKVKKYTDYIETNEVGADGSHKTSSGSNVESDLEEKKKKHKRSNTAGLHGVGYYSMGLSPSGRVEGGETAAQEAGEEAGETGEAGEAGEGGGDVDESVLKESKALSHMLGLDKFHFYRADLVRESAGELEGYKKGFVAKYYDDGKDAWKQNLTKELVLDYLKSNNGDSKCVDSLYSTLKKIGTNY